MKNRSFEDVKNVSFHWCDDDDGSVEVLLLLDDVDKMTIFDWKTNLMMWVAMAAAAYSASGQPYFDESA